MKRVTNDLIRILAALIAGLAFVTTAQTATIVVTTAADVIDGNDDQCSLREAIMAVHMGQDFSGCVNGLPEVPYGNSDTVFFNGALNGATITLTEGQLEISQELTIREGPTAGLPTGITIDGGGNSRIFRIEGSEPSEFIVEIQGIAGGIRLTGGRAVGAGAVFVGRADLVLRNVEVTDNSTLAQKEIQNNGGGLFISEGDVTLINSTVSRNSTTEEGFNNHGGGVHVDTGVATLINSTLSGNSAGGRGGGLNLHFNAAASLFNSTISGNSAGAIGGGIHVCLSDCAATLSNVTIAENTSAEGGGGVGGLSKTTMSNSIIARNAAEAGSDCGGTIISSNYNLIGDITDCDFDAMDGDLVNVNPRLGPLGSHGGPTRTHPLLENSPAIDAGNPGQPGSGSNHCESDDQRSLPRPGAGSDRCDIGAFEFQVGQDDNELFRDRFAQ